MTQTLAVHHLSSLTPPSKISQSGTSSHSAYSTASSSTIDTKRTTTRKDEHFTYKHGQRHHSYDREKAPYPLSYDRSILELYVLPPKSPLLDVLLTNHRRESLENKFIQHVKGSVSFINFKEHPPRRVLDLGCGVRRPACQTCAALINLLIACSLERGSLTRPRNGLTASL